MSTGPAPTFRYDGFHDPGQLAVLLDSLGGVTLSDSERRALAWLSGWERHIIEDIAAVIIRARKTTREGGK